MEGQEAFSFVIFIIVTPLFLLVFGTALFVSSPVWLPIWLGNRLVRKVLASP